MQRLLLTLKLNKTLELPLLIQFLNMRGLTMMFSNFYGRFAVVIFLLFSLNSDRLGVLTDLPQPSIEQQRKVENIMNKAFDEVLSLLRQPDQDGNRVMSFSDTDKVVRLLAERIEYPNSTNLSECLSADLVYKALGRPQTSPLGPEEWAKTSLTITYYVVEGSSICNNTSVSSCSSYECIRNGVLLYLSTVTPIWGSIDIPSLEDVLKVIKPFYRTNRTTSCFSARDLFEELNVADLSQGIDRDHVHYLASVIVLHLLRGDCIVTDEDVDAFLMPIFSRYGHSDNGSAVIAENGLERLMSDMGMRGKMNNELEGYDHDHDHDHDLDHRVGYAANPATVIASPAGGTTVPTPHDHDHDHDHNHIHHDHHHDHDHHDHYNNYTTTSLDMKNSSSPTSTEITNDVPKVSGGNRAAREVVEPLRGHHNHGQHDNTFNQTQALASNDKRWPARELMFMFDQDESHSISRSEFLLLCPALIQQKVMHVTNTSPDVLITSTAESVGMDVYLYSFLAVLVMSLVSLCGAVVVPFVSSVAYKYAMMCFIALAFGTMTGDAFLHLIPQALGLHDHSAGSSTDNHGHSHGGEEGGEILPDYFFKCMGLLFTVYFLFVFECFMEFVVGDKKHGQGSSPQAGHGHSHIPELPKFYKNPKTFDVSVSKETLASNGSISTSFSIDDHVKPQNQAFVQSPVLCCGMQSLALVIIIGDALHNFGDGLATGAAFSSGIKGGLSTTLAIMCHEVPHELGDFVILLSTGMSLKKALIWNLISSLTAFIGLFIGLQIGTSSSARQWAFAVTAGMFIYIALADMLPEMKKFKTRSGWKVFIAQNIGVIAGMAIMMLIAIFEDKIQI